MLDTGKAVRCRNGELENYCQPGSNTVPCVASQPNAYQVGNGDLVIQARRDSSGSWTSARLKTQGIYQFQYGNIEARMKLPVAAGLWPAFWMFGATSTRWDGRKQVRMTSWSGCNPMVPLQLLPPPMGRGTPAASASARATPSHGGRIDDGGYHTYGLIWSPNLLQYYRDNPSNIFLTITPSTIPAGTQWVYNNPFFILLNFAIGSGGFPGLTDGSTPTLANMLIDYVRVYQQGSGSAPASLNGTHTLTPQNATGLRLDDVAASTAIGNPIDIYTANGTGAQNWAMSNTNTTPAGYYNLATEGSNCLTASSGNSGSAAQLQPCNGSAAQAWNTVAAGSNYAFHPANNTSLCLDVRSSGTGSGTIVQSWTCNGSAAQQWAVN